MKQSVVILSLLLCLICAVAAKSGLSHKIRKANRVALAQEEEPEEEEEVQLTSPLIGRSPQDESSTETEEEETLDVRVNAIREDNIEEGANLDYTELCKLKNGYVNLVTDYQTVSEEQPNMKANNLPILSIKRVFAVLNKQTLSIFENSNVNSLIRTINLSQVGSNLRPKRWNRAHCFQVMSRNAHHDEGNVKAWVDVNEPEDGALVAFCFSSEQKQVDWMEAIRHFQDCDVEVVDLPKHVQDQVDDIKEEEQEKIDEIKSDCKKTVVQQKNEYKIEHQEDEDIEDELREISAQLRKESAIETKQRLQYTEEAKRIEEQTCKLEKERECLEEMLRKREQVEQEAAASLIESASFKHEETLLQKAAKVVIQVKREETKKIKEQHEEYTREQLNRQEQIKQHMVLTTIQAEKNEDYTACTSLTKENHKEAIQQECSHEFISDKESCVTKDGFCSQCCAQYVGLNFMSTRTECVSTCESNVNQIFESDDEFKSCEKDQLDEQLEQENVEEATGDDVPEEPATIDEAVAEEVVAEDNAADEAAADEEVPEETVAESKKKSHKKIQRLRRRLLRRLRK